MPRTRMAVETTADIIEDIERLRLDVTFLKQRVNKSRSELVESRAMLEASCARWGERERAQPMLRAPTPNPRSRPVR